MSIDWAKIQGGPDFKGLLARRQMELDDLSYFAALDNIDAYGGALGKRGGSQLVNGYATFLTAPAVSGATTLAVNDGNGFVNGQSVYILSTVHTVVSHGAKTLQISPGLDAPTASNTAIGTQVIQGFPAPAEIQTLFQGVFRNGDMTLWAAVNCQPYKILAGQTPIAPTLNFPVVTVATAYAGNPSAAAFSTPQAISVGDWITFAGVSYSVQITGSYLGVFAFSPALPAVPTVGQQVTLSSLHTGLADPPPEFVQYGNMTYMTGGLQQDGAGHKWPTTAIAMRQDTPLTIGSPVKGWRMGLRPPYQSATASAGNVVTTPASGLVSGQTYKYRTRYYNSKTGQESEGGPEAAVVIGTAPNNGASLTIPGSPDPQCDQVRVYRTSMNGGGAWYRVLNVLVGSPTAAPSSTITNPGAGSTVVVYDYTADEGLGTQMRDLLDNCIPSNISILTIWGQANRLIGIDRVANAVNYSDQPDLATGRLKGESWPINNQIFVAYDDGDVLTGIASFFDSVLVFKERSVWRITGIPPDIKIEPLHFRQDQTACGCRTQRQIVIDHDEVIYRGQEAIYELNRFQGQAEGFKSQRLSLPIDELVQAQYDNSVEQRVGHGVYFRAKRQVRFWETTMRCLVLQFESSVEGEPFGWMQWIASTPDDAPMPLPPSGPRCSCIARYDPAVFRGVVNFYWSPGAHVDSANFVGIDGGYVAQLDIGQADYGCKAMGVRMGPLRLSPAGRGIAARGRAIDLQVQQMNAAAPWFVVGTDWMVGPFTVNLSFVQGVGTMDSNQIDLMGVPVPAFDTVSALISAPGHHHEWVFKEQDLNSYYRILGWTYWFQTLPVQAVWRRFKYVDARPTIINVPNP